MKEAECPRVCILRSPCNKRLTNFGYLNMQRLSANHNQISARVEIVIDCFPRACRDGRVIWQKGTALILHLIGRVRNLGRNLRGREQLTSIPTAAECLYQLNCGEHFFDLERVERHLV